MYINRMKEKRYGSGATFDTVHGFVLTGGYGDDHIDIRAVYVDYGRLDTAEHTFNGETFESFAAIPIKVYYHCLVSLENGGDLFQTGGWIKEGLTKDTYIYRQNSGRWEAVANMFTKRRGESTHL